MGKKDETAALYEDALKNHPEVLNKLKERHITILEHYYGIRGKQRVRDRDLARSLGMTIGLLFRFKVRATDILIEHVPGFHERLKEITGVK